MRENNYLGSKNMAESEYSLIKMKEEQNHDHILDDAIKKEPGEDVFSSIVEENLSVRTEYLAAEIKESTLKTEDLAVKTEGLKSGTKNSIWETEESSLKMKELTEHAETNGLTVKTEEMAIKTVNLTAESGGLTVDFEEWELFFDSNLSVNTRNESGSDHEESKVRQPPLKSDYELTSETNEQFVSKCFVKLERLAMSNLVPEIKSEQSPKYRTCATIEPDTINFHKSTHQTLFNIGLDTMGGENDYNHDIDDFSRVKHHSSIEFKEEFDEKLSVPLPECYVSLKRLSSEVLSTKIKIEVDTEMHERKVLLDPEDIRYSGIKDEADELKDNQNLTKQESCCNEGTESSFSYSMKTKKFVRKGVYVPPTASFTAMEFWNVENFKCDHCSKEFSQKCCLQHHIRNHSLYAGVDAEGIVAQSAHQCRFDSDRRNATIKPKAVTDDLNSVKLPHESEDSSAGDFRSQDFSSRARFIWKDLNPEEYICEVCNRSCKNERALKCHMAFHVKPRFLQCPVCPFIVRREDYFKNHLMNHGESLEGFDVNKYLKTFQSQAQDVFYHCRFCASKFKEIEELKNHIKSHDVSRPFQCASCPYKTNRRGDLNKHIMQVHDYSLSYSCLHCPSKFKIKGALRQHMLCHKEESSFQCQLCPSKFKTITRLNAHIRRHNSTRDYQCPTCSSKFKEWSELQQHMIKHNEVRPFQCPSCPHKAKKKSFLEVHILQCHNENRPYECSICPMTFKMKAGLQEHLKRHSDVRPFQCPSCPSKFKDRYELKLHEMRHVKQRLYKCSSCPYKGKTEVDLKLHFENHAKDWLYQCSICPMKFKSRRAFWNHTGTHRKSVSSRQVLSQEDRQFKCSLCPKQFDHFLFFENHMKTHNSKKEHVCEHCGVSFKDAGSYKKHAPLHLRPNKLILAVYCAICREKCRGWALLRKHYEWHEKEGNDPLCFECDVCKVKFRTKFFLRNHIKAEHRGKTK